MPNFRCYYIPDAIIFITCVTRDRFPYLKSDTNIEIFFETIKNVRNIHPFRILAYVILPDHFHWLMRVDDPKGNFSNVLHSVKRNYTRNFKKFHDISSPLSVWQERYRDHVICDEQDLAVHFDYVHWNPVKHHLVSHPEDWKYSTYSHWQKLGYYDIEWGWKAEPANIGKMEYE